MFLNFTLLLISMNLIFHQVTSEPFSPTQNTTDGTSNDTYASNTPFANESDMESFIRNKWQDYPSFNTSPMVTPLKEILHTSFNPDQMKLRICDDVSLSDYKKLHSSHQPDHITVMMPSLHIPLKYFKWSLELMSILNDSDEKLRDKIMATVKNLNQLEKDGDFEISKLVKKCQSIVIVPRLFKGNFCEISPIIETYFPSLTNVSLIKLGGTILPYNSVKNIASENFHTSSNITWEDLENIRIPKDEDDISFENLKIVIDHFQRNLTLLYLRHEQHDDDDDSSGQKSVPLSHWANIYDTLHTNVRRYLKIINQNGSSEYERLPWIGFSKNTTKERENEIVSLHLTENFLSGDKFQSSADGLGHFGDMFHHSETEKGDGKSTTVGEINHVEEDDGKNSKNGENIGLREDLESPIVGLAPNSIYGSRTSITSQSKREPLSLNHEYEDNGVNFLNENKITNIDSTNIHVPEKNTTNFDLPTPIYTPDSVCVAISKFSPDFEIPASFRKMCPNLETPNMTQSRTRNHVRGPAKGSKSRGSTLLQNTASKKHLKNSKNNSNKFTDGSNANKKIFEPLVGKFPSSTKATIRNEGSKSTSIPDNFVSSFRGNGIKSSAILEDTLVDEIEDKFNSSRV